MFLMYDDGTKQERFLLVFIPLKQHWFLFIYLFLIDRLTVGLWSKVAEQAHYFFLLFQGSIPSSEVHREQIWLSLRSSVLLL